jgi:hypothetical protein
MAIKQTFGNIEAEISLLVTLCNKFQYNFYIKRKDYFNSNIGLVLSHLMSYSASENYINPFSSSYTYTFKEFFEFVACLSFLELLSLEALIKNITDYFFILRSTTDYVTNK